MKANRGDFQGELQTEVVDRTDRKVPLVAVPYEMTNGGPSPWPRNSRSRWNRSPGFRRSRMPISVNFKLAAGGGGPTATDRSMLLRRMPSYRYYFVVLSQAAGRYEYLDKKLDLDPSASIQADADTGPKYYEVVSMPAARRPNLPTNALYWTSIAYLLWDDFDPAQWDVDQQRALIDWLHWGGQIIVSGPDALEQLRDSFLRPYLPATVEKSRSFSADDLAELQYWAGEVGRPPRPVKPWPGAESEARPACRISSLYGRPAGRAAGWPRADRGLGLPPDRTGVDRLGGLRLSVQCLPAAAAGAEVLDRAGLGGHAVPVGPTARQNSPGWMPRTTTAVRYFARDTGVEFANYAADIVAADAATDRVPLDRPMTPVTATSKPTTGRRGRRRFDPVDKDVAPGWRPGTTSAPWPRPRATALDECLRHQRPGAELHRLGRGRLLVRARAGQLARFPAPGPRGMGVDRRAADRDRLHGRW